MDNTALVSVLVLNYNGRRFLDDCFNSLVEATYPNMEIIMIDNKSTDDSVDYVTKKFPSVIIFQNGVNGGFSLAYNNAFKIAKGKYLGILNNDVKVDKGWLEPMVEFAEKNPSVGAIQPKLLSMLEPNKFEYAGASGGYLDKYGFAFARGRVFDHVETDHGQYDEPVRVFWTTGAAMFVRTEALKYSGVLDVEFVHHFEEIDLCYRLNLAGYELWAIPQSVVLHFGGGIITYDSYKKLYWNHRNSVFMMLKSLEMKNLQLFWIQRTLLDGMAWLQALASFNFKRVAAIPHAYFWLLTHPGMILRKRKEVKRLRKISDKEIFKLLFPKSAALQYFLKGKKTYHELVNNDK